MRVSEFLRTNITTSTIVLFPLLIVGCADCGNSLQIRGQVVDAESGAAVVGAALGGRSFTGDAETDNAPPLIFNGTSNFPLSDADGAFVMSFHDYFGRCPAPEFPRPDRLEIIVLRDGCEQTVTIDINEETAIFTDEAFSHDALELTEPILVPPCAESP